MLKVHLAALDGMDMHPGAVHDGCPAGLKDAPCGACGVGLHSGYDHPHIGGQLMDSHSRLVWMTMPGYGLAVPGAVKGMTSSQRHTAWGCAMLVHGVVNRSCGLVMALGVD